MIRRKRLLAIAAATVVVAGACGSSSKSDSPATTKVAGSATSAAASGGATVADGKIKCTQQYKGKKVNLFSPIRDKDVNDFDTALKPFEECTGADVVWEGSAQFESDIKVRIDGGNAPDVINYPQPGLLAIHAKAGKLKVLPADMATELDSFVAGWKELATVDGKAYGLPLGANAKSFVWYSPDMFKAKGYVVPQTLDEMKALSDKIAADGGTPWCAGIESGAATGWVVTDWFEDFMLRLNGAEFYDQWVNHTVKFNDPKVKAVADAVASYLKNDKYVGNVKAIATTRFQDGGLPIVDGKCYMHRQASFYVSNWPAGTTFGDTGKINVFYLPVAKAGDKKPVLGGGEINSASNDKPETLDTIRYLGSKEFANTRAALGNWLSPRKDYDTGKIPDPFFKKFADILQKADVFRFDGSDLMPGQVGAGSFWKETTAWITGESTDDMLNNIEKSWPAS
jgi:alpha-glucoside transport system substrate-binding protein